jgi:hypothetical protein
MKTVGNLFKVEPQQWGLRGDPYLWKDLARVFEVVPLPESADRLKAMLEAAFLALTAHFVTDSEMFFVERYAHGGMSSGHIDPKFWRQKGLPLLLSCFIVAE